jgi:hypothetical protein
MSTKTIKQRIALVAVTALTAGFISVVSVPAANAISTGYGLNVAVGTNPRIEASNTLYIAGQPSLTGSAVVIGAPVGSAALGAAETAAARSLGLVNISDLAGGLTAGTTSTATLLNTGSISVYAEAVADKGSTIVVTGGTITATGIDAVTKGAISSSLTTAVYGVDAARTVFGAVVKPSSGVTSMTIQMYSGYALTATPSDDWTALLANPTGATGLVLEGQITVNITTSSTAGVFSTATSGVYGAVDGTSPGSGSSALTADETNFTAATAFNNARHLQIRVRDSFGNPITSTTGLLQVTATGGALVNVEATDATSAGTASTDFLTGAQADDAMVQVNNPTNAPLQTTVTATYGGVVVGSKTLVFTGKVAKMELYGAVIGDTGNAGNVNYVYYRLSDAAGNPTYNSITGVGNQSAYPYSTVNANASAITGAATGLTKNRDFSISASTSAVLGGRADFDCTSTAGKGTIGMTFTNLDGSIVTSNTLSVSCAGNAVTYKASWDKASYQPGDLATLTISAFDSKGNAANDVGAIATALPVVAIGGLDRTITGPTTADVLDQGKKTYSYTVGATEGTYSGKVTFSTIDDRYADTVDASGAAAVTTSITVKNSTATVTNADVLKSIVSLIASINKQIQALQKLILKR